MVTNVKRITVSHSFQPAQELTCNKLTISAWAGGKLLLWYYCELCVHYTNMEIGMQMEVN